MYLRSRVIQPIVAACARYRYLVGGVVWDVTLDDASDDSARDFVWGQLLLGVVRWKRSTPHHLLLS